MREYGLELENKLYKANYYDPATDHGDQNEHVYFCMT